VTPHMSRDPLKLAVNVGCGACRDRFSLQSRAFGPVLNHYRHLGRLLSNREKGRRYDLSSLYPRIMTSLNHL
jgi:hypothetical protein